MPRLFRNRLAALEGGRPMTPPDRTLVEVIARTLRDEVYEFSKAGARRVAHAIADSLATAGLPAAADASRAKWRARAEAAEAKVKELTETLEECCNPHRLERMRATEAKLEKTRMALDTLMRDVQDYEAWQRPCYALDKARAVLSEIDGEGSHGN